MAAWQEKVQRVGARVAAEGEPRHAVPDKQARFKDNPNVHPMDEFEVAKAGDGDVKKMPPTPTVKRSDIHTGKRSVSDRK